MLVRVVDKVNRNDPYLDVKLLKRGDVVVVCPDGWQWSALELKSADWRVMHFPDLSVEKAEAFLGPEFDTDPKNPSKMLRRRAFKVDLDSAILPADVKAAVAEGAKIETKVAVRLTESAALSLKVEKVRLEDPNKFDSPGEPIDGVKG